MAKVILGITMSLDGFAKIGKDIFAISYYDSSRRMKMIWRRGRPL
jgi:hypothetical protein